MGPRISADSLHISDDLAVGVTEAAPLNSFLAGVVGGRHQPQVSMKDDDQASEMANTGGDVLVEIAEVACAKLARRLRHDLHYSHCAFF